MKVTGQICMVDGLPYLAPAARSQLETVMAHGEPNQNGESAEKRAFFSEALKRARNPTSRVEKLNGR